MQEEKKTSITVEENGSKVNEPGATPQVQVENKEEASDAIPSVEDVMANTRDKIVAMQKKDEEVTHVVSFADIIAKGCAQGDTVFIGGQWIVEGEVTILAGDTNACKSTFVYNLALAISNGEDFLDTPTLECEVLYVETEMSSRQLYNRFKGVEVNENFKFLDAVSKTLDWILEKVEQYCKKRGKTEKRLVVAIDSISVAAKTTVTAKVAREAMKQLKALCALYGISVVVLVHNKKRDKKKPLQISDIQGSGKLVDMADNVFSMAKCGASEVYLKAMKLRSSRIEDTVKHLEVVDDPHLTVDFIQNTDEDLLLAKAESTSTKITPEVEVEIINLYKAGNSVRSIASEVGRSKSAVDRVIQGYKKKEAKEAEAAATGDEFINSNNNLNNVYENIKN